MNAGTVSASGWAGMPKRSPFCQRLIAESTMSRYASGVSSVEMQKPGLSALMSRNSLR